jgi:hypothetical protein
MDTGVLLYFEDLAVGGRIILKFVLKKYRMIKKSVCT